ncbi:uncharacterized protein LOC62_02G001790 [Vanrija pseudolonga]|uniref:Transcription factor domain-containing protein n=1 Tax=Vanrija pseudolonga TaxID=143232 RepID=A0AAF1BI10_9TREE|nr:hypothetical protein LOC62_02G001790 [Vanrija pseudolonga]
MDAAASSTVVLSPSSAIDAAVAALTTLSPGSPALSAVPAPFGQPFHAKADMLSALEPSLNAAIDLYFVKLHAINPIVDANSVRQRLGQKEHLHNEIFASMVLCMVAMRFCLPDAAPHSPTSNAVVLLREAMALASVNNDSDLRPTLDRMSAAMLMANVLRVTTGFNWAYVKTKEAITLSELLQLDDPLAYDQFTEAEKEIAISMFWKLAVAERSNALLAQHCGANAFRPSVSIRGQITHLSSLRKAAVDKPVVWRLEPTARLFEAMDPSLIDCITSKCSPPDCRMAVSVALLAHSSLDAVPLSAHQSPVQVADVLFTRLWMHSEVWRACMTHSLLQAEDDDSLPQLLVRYPVEVMAQACEVADGLSFEAILGNGQAMSNKLRAIASTADWVLSLPDPPRSYDAVDSIAEGIAMRDRLNDIADRLADAPWVRYDLPGLGHRLSRPRPLV